MPTQESLCQTCAIQKQHPLGMIVPEYKAQSTVLFLFDYPAIEDLEYGKCMSGLNKRSKTIHKLIKDTNLNQDRISFATVLRCITRSKARISVIDYNTCGSMLIQELWSSSISIILAFGSVAFRCVTGQPVSTIEDIRGRTHPTLIDNVVCIPTFSLSILTDPGCASCGKNIYPYLVRKDIEEVMLPEIRKREKVS